MICCFLPSFCKYRNNLRLAVTQPAENARIWKSPTPLQFHGNIEFSEG